MIRNLNRAVIDEIQQIPQLLIAKKKSVDEDHRPGRFLLTGSANLMALPTVADSLAGRMKTLFLCWMVRQYLATSVCLKKCTCSNVLIYGHATV